MDIGKVFVDSVIVGERHRALVEERVEALAESMRELGLQQPISVHVDDADAAFLVAGRHRLEAARRLGWEEMDAVFVDLSPVRREMWEIAENLFRADLTKAQRDEHIRRYADLLKKAEAEVQSEQNEPIESKRADGRGHRLKGVASKIADDTGLSKSTVQRALASPVRPSKPSPQPLSDIDATEKQYARIVGAWNAAGPEARQRFRAFIDEPVMDRRWG